MLSNKEKNTLLISNIIAIVISLIVCVPFGKTSVTSFELIAKFIVAPILIAVLVGITTYTKYNNFQPANKFIFVSAYTPFSHMLGQASSVLYWPSSVPPTVIAIIINGSDLDCASYRFRVGCHRQPYDSSVDFGFHQKRIDDCGHGIAHFGFPDIRFAQHGFQPCRCGTPSRIDSLHYRTACIRVIVCGFPCFANHVFAFFQGKFQNGIPQRIGG